MEWSEEPLFKEYLKADNELKNLFDKHITYEKRLKKMETKPFLTSEEKIEKKRLQIAKLAGKTRIQEILNEHRSNRP